MTEITDTLRDAKRLRLLACALELLQHERIDSAVIEIPGTEPQRYVAIGTAATIGKLLEIDQAPAPQAATWTKESVEKLSRDLAVAVAKNASTVPQLTFPDIYLGLCDALLKTPSAGYLTNVQITAGAAVKCDHGQPIGRNVAIDVFDAMKPASGQKGGAA